MRYSSLQTLRSFSRSSWLRRIPFFLRVGAVLLLIIALARPQSGRHQSKRKLESVDIMLVADASGSMKAIDLFIKGQRQTRLFVAAQAMSEFVSARTEDNIGLIAFGTNAYTLAPLTLDHDLILQLIDSMEVGMAGDSTAIGDAVGLAVSRLKDLPSRSKIIVLLTDGANDAGSMDPKDLAQLAKTFGIKIYTVGVGSDGAVPIDGGAFGYQYVRIPIDEELLQELAKITGGQYFRAGDSNTLFEIYKTIDQLEKTEMEVETYYHYDELFMNWVWAALLLLVLELLLRGTRLRSLP